MISAEFTPYHLHKALDVARHIATFGCLEFTADNRIRMRMIDPAKVIYMDFYITPDTYKCDSEFTFGVNLHMFYKIIKSLHPDHSIEIEADETVMKITQASHCIAHTIVAQQLPFPVPDMEPVDAPSVIVPTKQLQTYVHSLSMISPSTCLSVFPTSNLLILESINTMYRTVYSIPVAADTDSEYIRRFPVKFLEMAISPSLGDTVTLFLDSGIRLHYSNRNLEADVTVASYTEEAAVTVAADTEEAAVTVAAGTEEADVTVAAYTEG